MSDLKKVNAEIEDAVTGGFQKIESAVVGAYKQVEDAFVGRFLTREGETVEDAKKRLAVEQTAREEQVQAEEEKRAAEQKARIEASKHTGRP